MWDLPIYMGLVGSVAYVAYKLLYLMTGKEKLRCIRSLDSAATCDGILSASVSAAVRAVKEDGKKSV